MSNRADHLLCCAVTYRDRDVQIEPLPEVYVDVSTAVRHMTDVLWFEAKQSMSSNIDTPVDPYLHPVDIDTTEPGIVTSRQKSSTVLRRTVPLPRVVYDRRSPVRCTVRSDPPRTLTEARAVALEEKVANAASRRKTAQRDIKSDGASCEKVAASEEKKRARAAETGDERRERLLKLKEARVAKAELKKEQGGAEEAPRKKKTQKTAVEDAGTDTPGTDTPVKDVDVDQPCPVAEALELECTDAARHTIMPVRVRVQGAKIRYFATPVPFDRHLGALGHVALHPNLHDAVIHGVHSPGVELVLGPPGTGKTRYIVNSILPRFETQRVLLCAPTNVAVVNLYNRVVVTHPTAALLLPPSRIPAGTAVTCQNPAARVVCSTVSSRCGPVLDAERFDVIIVDEAAQCMEAWLWCLLRSEVHTLVLVGDTRQLPATVSCDGQAAGHGRSMLERLHCLQYPSTFLDVQYRMHPAIAQFPNRYFYDGQLSNGDRSAEADNNAGWDPYSVVDVTCDCEPSGSSFVNRGEAQACLELVLELQQTFETVVLITPYQGQARYFLAHGATNVHTIDSFQGQEADAVVVSVVRNEAVGFWSETRRLNVALTRARHCLRVVGSSTRWTGALGSLTADARERGLWRQVSPPTDG